MDFEQFDLRAASERGSWVHLESDDGPLYVQKGNTIGTDETDKPCRVRLLGIVEKGILNRLRELERMNMLHESQMARSADKAKPGLIRKYQDEVGELTAELIVSAVAEWEGIFFKGEALETNPENVLRICGPETYFFKQVYDAILERSRLFTGAAQG